MIENVIASILDAEKKAEEILNDGMKDYKKIILEAEGKMEKDKKEMLSSLKKSQDEAYAKAEKKADGVYLQIMEEGKEEAKTLKENSCKKTDEAVSYIVGKVI